jgi:predicted dehydrogenase
MGISIGIVGLGQFGTGFVDLFQAHPLVDRIALCDREPGRLREVVNRSGWQDKASSKFDPKDAHTSLEVLLQTSLDAVAIITQPWLHASQAIQSMQAGKHVYSAVPVISLPDGEEMLAWTGRIIETCRRTGMQYMLGETTVYRPETMFCRRKAAKGAFGDFVYAEGEYFHDLDSPGCSLREVQRLRMTGQAGAEWEQVSRAYHQRGIQSGPMHYPTHSISGPVSVMKTRALKVTAYGYRNRNKDPFFAEEAMSDEVALFQMENGASLRICEFRELAGTFHADETFRIIGTSGTYNERMWKENFRSLPFTARPLQVTPLTDAQMHDPLPEEVAQAFIHIQHPRVRLADVDDPSAYMPDGHGGSHPYLVHEFVDAVAQERLPAVNAWEAAKYMAMGVTAHKSALRDGERLDVPDFGDPPGSST